MDKEEYAKSDKITKMESLIRDDSEIRERLLELTKDDVIHSNESLNLSIRVYEYCKYLYEIEEKRGETLTNKANVYFGILTFILGATLLKEDLIEYLISVFRQPPQISWMSLDLLMALILITIIMWCVGIIFLVLALFQTIRTLKMMPNEGLIDNPNIEIIKKAREKGYSESEFLFARAIDFGTAYSRNSQQVNDLKARHLRLALIFINWGIGMVVFYIILYEFIRYLAS